MSTQSPELKVALRIGEPIEVWILSGDDTATYLSRIEDMHNDQVIIAAPMRKLDVVPVPVGRDLSLRVPRADALFTVNVRVEEFKQHPVPLVTGRIVSGWKRVQRRGSVRLNINIRPQMVDLLLPDGKRRPLNLTLRSISTGGVLLVSRRQGKAFANEIGPRADARLIRDNLSESRLHLQAALGGLMLDTSASLLRIEEVEDDSEYLYRVAARFDELDRKQEGDVFRFIFDEQQRQRRKDL